MDASRRISRWRASSRRAPTDCSTYCIFSGTDRPREPCRGRTYQAYPDQIEAFVAAGHDQLASAVSLAELRAVISPFGFRLEVKMHQDELRQLAVPTLLIWGDHDPVGGAEIARATTDAIPDAQLELLPAGHGPWLGHPDRTVALVANFVR